ncbi:MAG: hypothetical protein Q9162_005337 [Coniocarpon cinnabarinum]
MTKGRQSGLRGFLRNTTVILAEARLRARAALRDRDYGFGFEMELFLTPKDMTVSSPEGFSHHRQQSLSEFAQTLSNLYLAYIAGLSMGKSMDCVEMEVNVPDFPRDAIDVDYPTDIEMTDVGTSTRLERQSQREPMEIDFPRSFERESARARPYERWTLKDDASIRVSGPDLSDGSVLDLTVLM